MVLNMLNMDCWQQLPQHLGPYLLYPNIPMVGIVAWASQSIYWPAMAGFFQLWWALAKAGMPAAGATIDGRLLRTLSMAAGCTLC